MNLYGTEHPGADHRIAQINAIVEGMRGMLPSETYMRDAHVCRSCDNEVETPGECPECLANTEAQA